MKKKSFLSILLVSLFLLSCSEDIVNNKISDEGFNIYLLKDTTITTNQIMSVNLDDLTIADQPILSYKDIVYYNWSNHSFEIKLSKANEIKSFCSNHISVRGIPFVVTVDRERIYLGSFWASYSSLAPVFPHLEATYLQNETPTVLTIEKSWDNNEQDVREDQRIYNSLKKYGLLIFN